MSGEIRETENPQADPGDQKRDDEPKRARKAPTAEVSPAEHPNPTGADAAQDKLDRLQDRVEQLTEELARMNARIANQQTVVARALPATVDLELQTNFPAWVARVSGMTRAEAKGWAILVSRSADQDVLLVVDKDGGNHRFSFLPHQRDDSA